MFRRIDDFATVYENERASTLKIFDNLTDASLSQAVDPEGRTLGRLAWHITQTPVEMLAKTGVTVNGPGEHDPVPASAKKIRDTYEQVSAQVAKAVRATNTDASLDDVLDMYGEKWTRGMTLLVLLMHEAHHRGQMTVLMRQAGLKVPGVVGPAREDWAQWGMPRPEI